MTATTACLNGCKIARQHVPDCADPDCRGCLPRPATHGLTCYGCRCTLEQGLVDLPRVYLWLGIHVGRAGSNGPRGPEKPTKAVRAPSPINEDVVDLQTEMRDAMAFWTRTLLTEAPELTAPARQERMTDYLLTHLDRVGQLPMVADLADDLADLMRRAHRVAPWRAKVERIPAIPCPECHAVALVRHGGRDDVACGACSAAITGETYDRWVGAVLRDAREQAAQDRVNAAVASLPRQRAAE